MLSVLLCAGVLSANAFAMGKKPVGPTVTPQPSVPVRAECNLARPEVRELVAEELKTRTDADLSKAYWVNSIKSDTYSVFVVQFKRHDNSINEDKIYTLTASVSCDTFGSPIIDSDLDWAIPLSAMTNL